MPFHLALPMAALGLALAGSAVASGFASFHANTPIAGPVGASCVLGENGPYGPATQFIAIRSDEYYTLIDPAACACQGRIHLSVAHVGINWSASGYLIGLVSIVGADGAPGCWVPNSTVLHGPFGLELISAGGPMRDHALVLPADCCIEGPAFLRMVFYGGSLSGPQSPTLITDTSPDPCRSYAVHAGDAAYHDLTAEQGVQGNPVMWVDGNCCVDVPPGKLVAPDVIQAGPDGRFQYQWIYVVSAPDGLGSLGAENLENTDVSGIGDGFCENTVQPGYVIRWDVSGLLTDPARAGRVLNWLELCGARSAESETVIQPPVPTAATRSTWGQLKVRYR